MIEQFRILKNNKTCFLNFQEFLANIFKNLQNPWRTYISNYYLTFSNNRNDFKILYKNSFVFNKQAINMQLEKDCNMRRLVY